MPLRPNFLTVIVQGFAIEAKKAYVQSFLESFCLKKDRSVAVLSDAEDVFDWMDQYEQDQAGVFIDTVVTVIDVETFWMDLKNDAFFSDLEAGDGRAKVEVLMTHIEHADVLILSLSDAICVDIEAICSLLTALNPYAQQIRFNKNDSIDQQTFKFGLFDEERTLNRGNAYDLALLKAVKSEYIQHLEAGVVTWIWQRNQPLHPERFWNFLHSGLLEACGNIVRSYGYFWLGSRLALAGSWNQAGPIARHGVAGFWEDDMPRQELFFVATELDVSKLERILDECLLQDFEKPDGVGLINNDPFPEWLEDDDHDH